MAEQFHAVTSGFYPQQGNLWLGDEKSEPCFCVLKLHGAICYYADDATSYANLFDETPEQRAKKLFDPKNNHILPPMMFPWEMGSGELTGEFFLESQNRELGPMMLGIWARAHREVLAADKISFVGLSMHPFLFDGLKYLFKGKEGDVEICVVNPENTEFVPEKSGTHFNNIPHSPAFALSQVLNLIAPKMNRFGKSPHYLAKSTGDITLIKNFADFIRKEMKPISL